MSMKLSVVIPCFNEELNVGPLQEACVKAFEGKVESYELIFVNDGSRDHTWQALKALRHKGLLNFFEISQTYEGSKVSMNADKIDL